MCGIAGIVDYSGSKADRVLLEAMTHALAHRGPDGVGFFLWEGIGLGHRRLSIIDIEGGSQPIGNEDESIQVVFNGEIYNFIELREELRALGHEFRTRSDTEVIVHAYEQWGDDFPNRLNGIFAIAILDMSARTILLVRDHLGVKPLYYTKVGSQLLFASEIRSLMRHPRFQREVDRSALAELFTFRCVPSPKTLLKGVFKLPPGHMMRVGADGVSVQRFWKFVPRLRIGARESDLTEEYQELLEDAVRLQLRSDVPLGLFLSSGIDSGVLLALMAQHSRRPVEAFTIDFEDGQRTNESTDARRVARRFEANHHCLSVSAGDYLDYFSRYMSDVEEPVAHEAAPAFYFVSRLARDHVKVALSGQGADEPWAGYGRYVGVNLSTIYSRLPVGLTRALDGVIARLPLPLEKVKRGAASLGERDLLMRFVKIYSFFSADMKLQLYKDAMKRDFLAAPYAAADAIRHLQRDVAHLDPLTQILYMDTRLSLPDDLLMVGDKTSMANSIEVRVPFLDRRLVEFIESVPPDLKLRGLTGKYLHKKALLKWLPREDVYRRKKGFANPIGKWLRTTMRPLVEDCLMSGDSMISTYFDPAYIRRIVEADRVGRGDFTRHIYLLLSLELWHRTFMR